MAGAGIPVGAESMGAGAGAGGWGVVGAGLSGFSRLGAFSDEKGMSWLNWLGSSGLAYGLTYGLYGTILGAITTIMYYLLRILRDQLFTECVIQEYTPIDTWIKGWMAKKLTKKIGSRVTASMPNQFGMAGMNQFGGAARKSKRGADGEMDKAQIDFLPQENVGVHFWYKGKLCWISNNKEQTARMDGGAGNMHKIVITTLFGGRELITELIQEAQELYNEELKSKTVIRSAGSALGWGGGSQWQEMGARPSRPFDTVVLEPGIAQNIKEDVASFLDSASWYYSRGVPYRRGYLLYGPPGCGKTSFITALAGELHLPIYIINLTSKALTDDSLLSLMSQAEDGSILLLEDVDAAFKASKGAAPAEEDTQNESESAPPWMRGMNARENASAKGITFSGLLNAIDGVAAQEGKVLVMTTNHIDRLDEALIRPGRIDVRAYIGRISKSGAKALFLRFYRGLHSVSEAELDKLAEDYSAQVPDKQYAPALIQGHLMKHKFDPQAACADFDTLVKTVESLQHNSAKDAADDDDESGDVLRSLSAGLRTISAEKGGPPIDVTQSMPFGKAEAGEGTASTLRQRPKPE